MIPDYGPAWLRRPYSDFEVMRQQRCCSEQRLEFLQLDYISLSFVALVVSFSSTNMLVACLGWGARPLAILTWLVAKNQNANIATELLKHLAVATAMVAASFARQPYQCLRSIERDGFSSNRHLALSFCSSMIFFGKPVPTFSDHALGAASSRRSLDRLPMSVAG